MGPGGNSYHATAAFVERCPSVPARQTRNKQLSPEFVRDRAILEDALIVGCDYLEATGRLPSYDNFQALYLNRYCDYQASEIERIFGDWDVFWADVKIEFDMLQEKRQAKKKEILEIIDLDQQIGVLHPNLFSNTVLSKTFEQQASEDQGGKSRWNLHLFLDTEVDEDEKIARYARFKIAEALTPNLDDENTRTTVDPLDRRTSIALGFNVDTGLVLTSFSSEVIKSNSMLNKDEVNYEIEELAKKHGWMDYIYPESRSRDLLKLKKAAENWGSYPLPERSFYDTKKAKLLGRISLEAYMANPEESEHIKLLRELLIDEEMETRNSSAKAFEYKDRTEEEDIVYGQWLLGVLRPSDRNLTARIIRRASQLNLGPSPEYLTKTHGSLIKFYRKIGASVINAKGSYDNWDDEQIINHIRAVAEENDGRVTATILLKRIEEEGRNEPRPSYLKKRFSNLGNLFEMAGVTKVNQKLTPQDCIDSSINFLRITGKSELIRKDFRESNMLPSDYVVIRLFGSIENLNETIASHLEEQIAA